MCHRFYFPVMHRSNEYRIPFKMTSFKLYIVFHSICCEYKNIRLSLLYSRLTIPQILEPPLSYMIKCKASLLLI